MNSYMTRSERIQTFFATAAHKSNVFRLNMCYKGSVDLNASDLNTAQGSMIWEFERSRVRFEVIFEDDGFWFCSKDVLPAYLPPDEISLILRGMSEICHVVSELNKTEEV